MVTDDVFAVIAEATRRDILVSLCKGDKAVGELVQELAASQPTISKHLKVLREADLVSMRAQGQKRYYTLNPKPLAGIASWLETFDVGPGTEAALAAEPLLEPAPDAIAAAVTAPAGPAAVLEAAAATPDAAAIAAPDAGPAATPDAAAVNGPAAAPKAPTPAAAKAPAPAAPQAPTPAAAKAPSPAPAAELQPAAALAGRPAASPLSPAVVLPVGTAGEDRRPQQIGRTVGRAATRAADLLASLPKFGRRK